MTVPRPSISLTLPALPCPRPALPCPYHDCPHAQECQDLVGEGGPGWLCPECHERPSPTTTGSAIARGASGRVAGRPWASASGQRYSGGSTPARHTCCRCVGAQGSQHATGSLPGWMMHHLRTQIVSGVPAVVTRWTAPHYPLAAWPPCHHGGVPGIAIKALLHLLSPAPAALSGAAGPTQGLQRSWVLHLMKPAAGPSDPPPMCPFHFHPGRDQEGLGGWQEPR